MPGLKAPVQRYTETARGVIPDHTGLSSQERCLLRKRIRSELEVVSGLLEKAKVLVASKAVNGGAAPSKVGPSPRRSQRQERDQFAEKRKQWLEVEPKLPKKEAVGASGAISPSSLRKHEGGELAEEEDMYIDSCGDASPVAMDKVRCSSRLVRKDVELVEDNDNEFVDICGDASPIAIDKFSEACSSSSSSSCGSSCSDSSDSDSDSDDDNSACSSQLLQFFPLELPLDHWSFRVVLHKIRSSRAARSAGRITDHLIGRAHEEKRSRCRELDRKKAHEELQEMERMVMSSDSIHPRDMMLLGITVVEYIVSSDDETRTVRSM